MFRTAGISGNKGQINFCFLRGGQFDFGPFGSFFESLQRHPIFMQINPLIFFELLNEPVNDSQVEIVST